ncbi:MAG: pyruvate carboxylase [Gammaproteobacteria bacterium]|nr:pyruvate carboxylase [Gammaproteobacteria bacterium]
MPFRKILVANRGEIAIRVMRAASELRIPAVAIFSEEDRLSLHRFKADEAYQVGRGRSPVEAYLDMDDIIAAAVSAHCDAIHPGYGFLAENPDFPERCRNAGIVFIGPNAEVMRTLGHKIDARAAAIEAGVPVVPASGPLPGDPAGMRAMAETLGLPVMLKASWGGGGRGMRAVRDIKDLVDAVVLARSEAQAYFGNPEVYLEKLIVRPRHVEVQILGDRHGNVVHLYERDCSLQRRHQKMVERAPAPYLTEAEREKVCGFAVQLARRTGLDNAGTVEFLFDPASREFCFIEVNPRVQVEHTVTEEITGVDIVKAQIQIASGARIGDESALLPRQDRIGINGHALQCRVTTEDPHNNLIPDYGQILAYRSPAGPGIRLDGGTAYSGARITRYYDSLLVKVTAHGRTEDEAINRMLRAITEFHVRGVATNLPFLEQLLDHPGFRGGNYDTNFIDDTPDLFRFPHRTGEVEHLLEYLGEVIINGNPEMEGRRRPAILAEPVVPPLPNKAPAPGAKQMLRQRGARAVADWLKQQTAPQVTDTTFRDAHQSLFATRMRSRDMIAIAPHYARLVPALFSVESWGGATFDVALRFLREDPWQRLADLTAAMPNIMQQMLLRAANAVGYRNYPDNVVRFFVQQAAQAGVDVFRIFDSLNWIENMRPAIDAVGETGKIVEAAICYTGDILDPKRSKYDLEYYVGLARQLEQAGAHILGIKDMAGLIKPAAATRLISALKQAVGLPVHFHTHDTSGIAAASVLAAVDAGVDVFDAAMDSMSGLTSQPNLGSLVAALEHTTRCTGLDSGAIQVLSAYWEEVREQYAAFAPDIRSGTSDVYVHEMPGGQYTNLREQARSLGVDSRWSDLARAYAEVNEMFGDIIKVTPTSKVVGDMALAMVTGGLTREDVLNPKVNVSFPESVVSFFRGDLGQPPGGFPKALQKKVLGKEKPITVRPGSILPAVDLDECRAKLNTQLGHDITHTDLASSLMYPEVFAEFARQRKRYGDVGVLATHVYFYGMQVGEEIVVRLENGRQAIIRFLTSSDPDEDGIRRVFFEVNGQPLTILVKDRSLAAPERAVEKADPANPLHVAAPMPGLVVAVEVSSGQSVRKGDTLLVIEAMKMQTALTADRHGIVKRVLARPDHVVDAKDLLLEFETE